MNVAMDYRGCRTVISRILLLCVVVNQALAGGNAILMAKSSDGGKEESLPICVYYNSNYQQLPSTVTESTWHHLVNLSQSLGCIPNDFNNPPAPLENGAVAVSRSECTFVKKALMVQSFNGSAVLVVDLKNASHTSMPGGNKTAFEQVKIPLITLLYQDYQRILQLPGPINVTIYSPAQPRWDPNMILIVVFSTAFVMIAAGWAAYQESRSQKGSRRILSELRDKAGNDDSSPEGTKREEADISVLAVLIWFMLICAMLILLYFFYDYMVYFFIAIFCIAGSYSLYQCLLPVWSHLLPITYDIPLNKLPCFSTKIKLRSFLLLMPCLTVGIFWAVERHAHFAWVLQDLLGTTFCIFFIQSFRLPNLKIIAVLLLLLLVYDVFFVFITPLFTKDGNSIMESVATGGRSHSKESLPMVFLLPTIIKNPIRECQERNYSLLGFGDVIIPGLLIAYNAIFDVKTGSKMVYYLISSAGYLLGMIVCMISLVYMNSGQPALLYLVPGTLLSTVTLALIRGELHKLFVGQHLQKVKDNTAVVESQIRENDAEVEEGDTNNGANDEERRNLIN